MSEQLQVKRSLLWLRQATVAELANHSGVKLATVKSFLHDHPTLAERIDDYSLVGRRRGRPANVWRLLPTGEAAIREEMLRLTGVSDERAGERAKSEAAIRVSITTLLAAVKDLESRRHEIDTDEIEAERERLHRRVNATHVALQDLIDLGHSLEVESAALDRVTASLAGLGIARAVPEFARLTAPIGLLNVARETISRYMSEWFSGLRQEIEGFVTPEAIVMPEHLAAAPMLLLDGGREVDVLSRSIVDRYRMLGAPVLHLSVGDLELEVRQHLLEVVAHHLTLAVGATAQVVLTIDGSKPEAGALAREFAAIEKRRAAPEDGGRHELEGTHAREVMSVAAPLISRAGLTIGGFREEEPGLAAAALLITGRLIETTSRGQGFIERIGPTTGDLHVPPFCFDVSTGQSLAGVFESAGIGYVAGQTEANNLPSPLVLTADTASAFQERVIEVHAYDEVPVVVETARVVEEVTINNEWKTERQVAVRYGDVKSTEPTQQGQFTPKS